ncbi:LANO_0E03972g1_1 [Lachancea nothofagi CBS 11611]|uniref:LANO_0E03972g1_1 n=1 Tax=Lachancea nothofagi CBS 11611 TaxID=1266666 RepID=A0A1G4JRL3_9SACH|nr:LANO_0E03972g1_1 [Lachancea nothofagi CBS 11611]
MPPEKLKELLNWGYQHGVQHSKDVEFVQTPDKGISVVAKSEISNASFQVPIDIVIRRSLAEQLFQISSNHNTWLKFLVAKLKFDSNATVVESQNLKTKFAPYIDALPREIDSPLVWNPMELNELGNTNLGSSLTLKLESIFLEWKSAVIHLEECNEDARQEIVFTQQLLTQDKSSIFTNLTSKVFSSELQFSWWSFPAFLWSHLIFLSRSFPEYVVNPDADPSSVILLPIVDLLNHDYNSKVEWKRVDDSFCVQKLETVMAGQEICNNYGGKGNEELLSGYGFVLESNIFDTAALKVRLSQAVLTQILRETQIKLPNISDYTTSAFDFSAGRETVPVSGVDISKYEDGVLYLLSQSNSLCLDWLLDMFAFIEKSATESYVNLRPRLQGLQNLRAALEAKLATFRLVPEESQKQYSISTYRAKTAQVYKSGQTKIVKHAINELKRLEKEWTTKYKRDMLTVKKLMRIDQTFLEVELPAFLQLDDNSDIALDSYNTLFYLWVLCKHANGDVTQELRWVMDLYDTFTEVHENEPDVIDKETKFLHQTIFTNDSEKLSLKQLALAVKFVNANSYTRLSKGEMILVRNVNL